MRTEVISFRTLALSALVFIILLSGCQTVGISVYSPQGREEYIEATTWRTLGTDPVMSLLGQDLDEIERLLGSPDEQGYDDWRGPHYYTTFHHEKGAMRIFFPEDIENRFAVSIILGPGRQVLGVKVGMSFEEIETMLGAPDFGPERGMDDLYYIDYYFGEVLDDGMPEVFVSFSAPDLDSPTDEAFIKREILQNPLLESSFTIQPIQ